MSNEYEIPKEQRVLHVAPVDVDKVPIPGNGLVITCDQDTGDLTLIDPDGITFGVSTDELVYSSDATPVITQATGSGAGGAFTIAAQDGGEFSVGGALDLSSGKGNGGEANGAVNLQTGGTTRVSISDTGLSFAAAIAGVTVGQGAASGTGGTLTLTAQAAGGTSKNGGDLCLSSGSMSTGGAHGSVDIQVAGSNALTAGPSGVALPSMTTAGIVHNAGTTGLLSSSLLVNADVAAAAAIAGSKVTPAFGSQALGCGVATPSAVTFGASNTTPTVNQTQAASGNGVDMTITAQAGYGTGATNGGDLVLAGGAKNSSGTDGSVRLSQLVTAGLVHAAVTTGKLTSSLLVDADVDAAAAIAQSKISPVAPVQNISGNQTLNASCRVAVVDNSGDFVAIQLPSPATSTGRRVLLVVKITMVSNTVILIRAASEKIDGAAADKTLASATLLRVWLTCDGTDWYTSGSAVAA